MSNLRLSQSPSPEGSPLYISPNEEILILRRRLRASEKKLAEVSQQQKRVYTITTHGRSIRRLVSCFENVLAITSKADRRRLEECLMDFEESDSTTEAQKKKKKKDDEQVCKQNRTFAAFKILIKVAPQLLNLLSDADVSKLTNFAGELQEGANSARNDDNSRIKSEVATWVNFRYDPEDRLDPRSRSNRGLQHDVCGMLLSPIEVDWNVPDVRTSIRNGTSSAISESYFLRCLYPNELGDPDNVENGFLRNPLLLLTFYAIFISPSVRADHFDNLDERQLSLKQEKSRKSPKRNNAMILCMNERVSGRAIAYAAVMLVFNLTDAAMWTEDYNTFSFYGFYNFLVDYFEVTPDEASESRVQNLLNWWNGRIFPGRLSTRINSNSSEQKLAAQRARST